MEFLKFDSNGQWTLCKSRAPYGGSKDGKDEDFQSFRPNQGQLPEDHGRKGWLHNSGNARPPKKIGKDKMDAKVPTPVASAHADQNPGVGQ